MRESKIQRDIRKYMIKQGFRVLKAIQLSESGWPDLMCMKGPGRVVWIEVKRPGEKPEPLQDHRLKELRKMGFIAFYAETLNDVIKVIQGCK